MSTPTATNVSEDEIDLRELFLALWEKKHIIVVSAVACLVLASIYAFLIVKPVYESSALLLPTQAPSADQLGAAAALLGGKKAGGSPDVDLYQSLLTSRTVIHKLLNTNIRNESDTGKSKLQPLSQILGVDTSKQVMIIGAIEDLAKSVYVESKQSGAGGIIEVKFSANSPWLAQQIGNAVLEIGQEELRLVRIERSDVILSRLSIAVAQARSEWDTTARILTYYRDRNRSIILPDQMLEFSRLEMEKSAKEQKYLLARKEYEIQMLERAKAAPPMMILDPANRPARKEKSKNAIILMASILVGAIGSSVYILGTKAFKDYLNAQPTR